MCVVRMQSRCLSWLKMGRDLSLLAALFPLVAEAETVTIDTAAGTTNRLQQIYSGTKDLSINSGATGGVVLPRPYSTYSGTTTLGSGTLVVAGPVRDGANSELGASGPFVQTGGTLQYTGPAGGVWTRPITNSPAAKTNAVVWQIDNDLTVDADVYQGIGAFVKTGAGTLTFQKPFVLGSDASTSGTRKNLMDLSPDRAPTKGYGPVSITDGRIVIDTGSTATNILGGAADIATIGAYTTETGTETAAEIIQSNGVTKVKCNLGVGFWNGNTANNDNPLTSALRIHGGTFYVGEEGKNTLYLGIGHSSIKGTPLLEVAGANSKLYCDFLTQGYSVNQSATTIIRDGGLIYCANSSFPMKFGENAGNAQTTNTVEVTGTGSTLYAPSINTYNNVVANMRIADGGKIQIHRFANGKGTFNIVFDGGIWSHTYWANSTAVFPAALTSVKIGPGGMIASLDGNSSAQPLVFEKGFEPLDDSGTDGGIKITQGSRRPQIRFNAAHTYCGPTEISQTSVYLGKNGRLPSGTALSIYTNYGGLIITNGITQTVGSFTFGRDSDDTDSPILGFGPNASLNVTGAMHVGNRVNSPKIYLYGKQGGTDALSAAGTRTIITAREEDFSELVKLAGLATFPSQPEGVSYTCTAEVSGGRARLLVTVTTAGNEPAASGDPLLLNNTVLDQTLTATAEQIAAARTIYTNPGYPSNKHGPVELGALTGFPNGGKLVTGSGMTYVSDLSFANSVSNITLKFGTLAYTGGDAAIPGFTLESSENRSSVLNITNENTTLTIGEMNAIAGGFTKKGPGTLKLKPPAGVTLTLPSDYEDNGDNNGVTAYGDGPASGTRAVNLTDGWTEIGTVGDSADAPDIFGPKDFSVGSQSSRKGIAEQTAGNLRMNNGSLSISTVLYIGYYCGNYASNPNLNLTPTLEQNGGFITCNKMQIGQSASSASGNRQTDSPRYFLHGGTNLVRDTMYPAYTAVSLANTWRTTINVDGGMLVVSNNVFCGNDVNSMATDFSITGNGRVEIGDTFYPAYNVVRETNTFTLAGNGVLRAKSIDGNQATAGLVATFDGGTFESALPSSGHGFIRNLQRAYIGAGGLNIDLSQHAELETRANWLVVQQAFGHDPACEGVDGGITIRGKGSVALSTGMDAGTFTGPIRAMDQARVCSVSASLAPFALQVAPGCILHDYTGTNVVKDLTLGETDASVPVSIEQLAGGKALGFIVTNDLQILSPVTFTTVTEAHDFQPRLVSGVYTALVYNASCADVDLTLFGLAAADAELATLTASQVTISDGGEFDGMKAVVLTVSAKNTAGVIYGNAWSSVSNGGNWGTAANWDNATLVPNARGVEAYFKPATAAGVGVTLDTPVTVGSLTLNGNSATSGYTLSGSALTLDSDDSTPVVVNASGTNTIAAPIALAKTAQFRTTAGNELRVTGGVSGSGDLNVNTHVTSGAGQVNLTFAPAFVGSVKTGSGRVVMDDLSFVQQPSQLTLGIGTLHYTGADAEIPGMMISAGSGRAAVFENDADVTLRSLTVSGSSAFLKRGVGTLRLHGTSTLALNTYKVFGNINTAQVSENGDSPASGTISMMIAGGSFVQGEVGDPANAPVITATSAVGPGCPTQQGDATYELNNGSLSAVTLYLGYYQPALPSCPTLTFRQNGGSMTLSNAIMLGYTGGKWDNFANAYVEINGGTSVLEGNLNMGRDTADSPTATTNRFVMNGGSMTVKGTIYLAYSANAARGFMELNGGVLSGNGNFYAANATGNATVLRLNEGGTLRCNRFVATASGSTTRFYANGGELIPPGLTAAGMTMPANAFTYLYASTNGLVVNTEELATGGTYTMNQAVLHDPDCPATTDGGFTKRGANTLVLAGGNTYLGDTTVEGGVLRIASGDAFASGKVTLADSAIEVTSGSLTLKELAGYGSVTCEGVTVTNCIAPSAEDCIYASGDVTLTEDVTLDLSAFEDEMFAAKDRLLLLVTEGTVRAPEVLAPTPASKMTSAGMIAKPEVVGGALYVVFSSGGTILFIR